jgi:truncated hemoglobin YjbI
MMQRSDSPTPSIYHLVGGSETFYKLARAFYARVENDPVLRPLYPRHLDGCPTRNLSRFLTQFFGGPCEHSQHSSQPSLREAHARFRIGPTERDAWLRNMTAALEDVGIQEPARSAMRSYFAEASAFLMNSPEPARETVPIALEVPTPVHREVGKRWAEQRAYEELVSAALAGEAERVLQWAESDLIRAQTHRDPASLLTMLAVMHGTGDGDLMTDVQRRLKVEPSLASSRYGGGRTLLHDAAGHWSVAFAELLLGLGADPNATDDAGHAPLYTAGNRFVQAPDRSQADGGAVVRLLVQAGADVNACGGVKACTALHMAARRGNVAVAEALIEAGAEIEARDDCGDTPLRRAVNCGQPEIAALLLSHGADLHSRGSRGLTPLQVARSASMQALLQRAAGAPKPDRANRSLHGSGGIRTP